MKNGILSQTAYRRSVYKKLNAQNKTLPKYVWERCTYIEQEADTELIAAEAMLAGKEPDLCVYCAARALTAAAAEGGRPSGVRVSVLVPETKDESCLEEMLARLSEAASEEGFEIWNVYTAVQPGIRFPVVSVTGFAEKGKKGTYGKHRASGIYGGRDIVQIHPAALEGSLRLLEEKKAELNERFIPVFLNGLKEEKRSLFGIDAVRASESFDADYIKPVTDGGIFGALWELAETLNTGFEVDLKRFVLRQETVEICELFHLNPYQMAAGGALLAVVKDGAGLAGFCERAGMEASVIGKMKKGKDKIILNGEERRCTDRPAEDEWFRVYKEE